MSKFKPMVQMLTAEDFTNRDRLSLLHESVGLPQEFYFSYDELKCPHCGALRLDLRTYYVLMKLRLHRHKPVIVTSGFRCEEYNRMIGGVSKSAHTLGFAVDIAVGTARDRLEIVRFLTEIREPKVERIGVAEDFIHFDFDYGKPFPVMWVYGAKRHIA